MNLLAGKLSTARLNRGRMSSAPLTQKAIAAHAAGSADVIASEGDGMNCIR